MVSREGVSVSHLDEHGGFYMGHYRSVSYEETSSKAGGGEGIYWILSFAFQ